MKRHLSLAAAGLMSALIAGAVMARPPDTLGHQPERSSGAVSLADFRQLQAEVQDLRQQVARLERRLDALGGRKGGGGNPGGGQPGGPGNRPGCPQCP